MAKDISSLIHFLLSSHSPDEKRSMLLSPEYADLYAEGYTLAELTQSDEPVKQQILDKLLNGKPDELALFTKDPAGHPDPDGITLDEEYPASSLRSGEDNVQHSDAEQLENEKQLFRRCLQKSKEGVQKRNELIRANEERESRLNDQVNQYLEDVKTQMTNFEGTVNTRAAESFQRKRPDDYARLEGQARYRQIYYHEETRESFKNDPSKEVELWFLADVLNQKNGAKALKNRPEPKVSRKDIFYGMKGKLDFMNLLQNMTLILNSTAKDTKENSLLACLSDYFGAYQNEYLQDVASEAEKMSDFPESWQTLRQEIKKWDAANADEKAELQNGIYEKARQVFKNEKEALYINIFNAGCKDQVYDLIFQDQQKVDAFTSTMATFRSIDQNYAFASDLEKQMVGYVVEKNLEDRSLNLDLYPNSIQVKKDAISKMQNKAKQAGLDAQKAGPDTDAGKKALAKANKNLKKIAATEKRPAVVATDSRFILNNENEVRFNKLDDRLNKCSSREKEKLNDYYAGKIRNKGLYDNAKQFVMQEKSRQEELAADKKQPKTESVAKPAETENKIMQTEGNGISPSPEQREEIRKARFSWLAGQSKYNDLPDLEQAGLNFNDAFVTAEKTISASEKEYDEEFTKQSKLRSEKDKSEKTRQQLADSDRKISELLTKMDMAADLIHRNGEPLSRRYAFRQVRDLACASNPMLQAVELADILKNPHELGGAAETAEQYEDRVFRYYKLFSEVQEKGLGTSAHIQLSKLYVEAIADMKDHDERYAGKSEEKLEAARFLSRHICELSEHGKAELRKQINAYKPKDTEKSKELADKVRKQLVDENKLKKAKNRDTLEKMMPSFDFMDYYVNDLMKMINEAKNQKDTFDRVMKFVPYRAPVVADDKLQYSAEGPSMNGSFNMGGMETPASTDYDATPDKLKSETNKNLYKKNTIEEANAFVDTFKGSISAEASMTIASLGAKYDQTFSEDWKAGVNAEGSASVGTFKGSAGLSGSLNGQLDAGLELSANLFETSGSLSGHALGIKAGVNAGFTVGAGLSGKFQFDISKGISVNLEATLLIGASLGFNLDWSEKYNELITPLTEYVNDEKDQIWTNRANKYYGMMGMKMVSSKEKKDRASLRESLDPSVITILAPMLDVMDAKAAMEKQKTMKPQLLKKNSLESFNKLEKSFTMPAK